MKPQITTLKNLAFNELLQQLALILQRDEENLEANTNHYKRLLADENTHPSQIDLFFQKLEMDRQRLTYFNELHKRLNQNNFKFILTKLISELENNRSLSETEGNDWSATIYKKNGKIKIYFFPISNLPFPE